MIHSIKNELLKNITNARGWKTKRKIIVFESDDWGSIMMKSKDTYNRLLEKGIPVDSSKYSMLDCLETRKDLDDLFNVLQSHKNSKGKCPKFTFNTVMENPNFDEIRKSNFESYVGESFVDSYKTYYNENNIDLWHLAIEEEIINPQFHAKEHFNRFFWMDDLRKKNRDTLIGFENSFFGMGLKTSSKNRKRYLETYNAESVKEYELIRENLKIGLKQFEGIFGFNSQTFIASNYTWPKELEEFLKTQNVYGLQGNRVQLTPQLNSEGLKIIRHYTGERNKYNQIYTVRNTVFEPYSDPKKDWIESVMKEIKNAFFWKKPAIVETHRINYVSSLSIKNKDENLALLDRLLNTIIETYPDIEFLSSNSLLEIIKNTKRN